MLSRWPIADCLSPSAPQRARIARSLERGCACAKSSFQVEFRLSLVSMIPPSDAEDAGAAWSTSNVTPDSRIGRNLRLLNHHLVPVRLEQRHDEVPQLIALRLPPDPGVLIRYDHLRALNDRVRRIADPAGELRSPLGEQSRGTDRHKYDHAGCRFHSTSSP